MIEITILLPFPDKILQPNARCHWRVKAKATKANREQVKLLCIIREVIPEEPITNALVTFHFRKKTKRKQDADNALAWLKSTIDGLVDAGVFSDDKELSYAPITQAKETSDFGVHVTIEESNDG